MDSPNVGKVLPTPISASTATEKTGVKPQITDIVKQFRGREPFDYKKGSTPLRVANEFLRCIETAVASHHNDVFAGILVGYKDPAFIGVSPQHNQVFNAILLQLCTGDAFAIIDRAGGDGVQGYRRLQQHITGTGFAGHVPATLSRLTSLKIPSGEDPTPTMNEFLDINRELSATAPLSAEHQRATAISMLPAEYESVINAILAADGDLDDLAAAVINRWTQFGKQCASRTAPAAFATGPPSLEVWIAAIQDSIDNLNLQKDGAGRGKRGGNNEKPGVCFFHKKGACTRGDSCRYSHGGEENEAGPIISAVVPDIKIEAGPNISAVERLKNLKMEGPNLGAVVVSPRRPLAVPPAPAALYNSNLPSLGAIIIVEEQDPACIEKIEQPCGGEKAKLFAANYETGLNTTVNGVHLQGCVPSGAK